MKIGRKPMKLKKLCSFAIIACLITSTSTLAQASEVTLSSLKHSINTTKLQEVKSEIIGDKTSVKLGDNNKTKNPSTFQTSALASVANKYLWNNYTIPYSFSSQQWSTNQEIYGTYAKNNGFVSAGYLFNPTNSSEYADAVREGYLNDSSFVAEGGHYYSNIVTSLDSNDLTLILEPNVQVYIFDSDINMIYSSKDETGDSSYFTRYYSTNKYINNVYNKVISMGLVTGSYYLLFDVVDIDATSGFHYAFYSGQPLPMEQYLTSSSLTHNGTIYWDGRSYSQELTTQTVTVNVPDGYENEYALTYVKFQDLSKPLLNNRYADEIDYYYTSPESTYFRLLQNRGDFWGDKVDTPYMGRSIDGNYQTKFEVNWSDNLSYVNASCSAMTKMTLTYLAPFGIIVG